MKKSLILFMTAAFSAAVLISGCSITPAASAERQQTLRILSWNCQTLFDDSADGTEYADFREDSWNTELYRKKLENIASVIRASTPGGPDIIALQEIENGKVLQALAGEFLSGLGYAYSAVTSVPGSALQVGILSRIEITGSISHGIAPLTPRSGPLRSILETRFTCGDTGLVVFNNHWKSKSGGGAETENVRIRYAEVLARRYREILSADPGAEAVMVGDLNESVDEFLRTGASAQTALLPFDREVPADWESESLFLVPVRKIGSAREAAPGARTELAEPWSGNDYPGSYHYRGAWLTLDHALLSPSLFNARAFEFESFRVIREPFMCTQTGTPLEWDTRNSRGYSDHFPLLLTLKLQKETPG